MKSRLCFTRLAAVMCAFTVGSTLVAGCGSGSQAGGARETSQQEYVPQPTVTVTETQVIEPSVPPEGEVPPQGLDSDPYQVTVPPLIGVEYQQAREWLWDIGLSSYRINTTSLQYCPTGPWYVAKTKPRAGEPIESGAKVVLDISC